MCFEVRRKWVVMAVAILLALPAGAKTKHPKAKAKTPAVTRAQKELAQQMVRDAYGLGAGLDARQRVALITRLLYTMRPEVMAQEKERWAEEMFRMAQKLPPRMGDGAIATAASRMAVYDPDRAMELLDTLPSGGGRRTDGRMMAARLVFASYMRRHGTAGAQTLLNYGRKWGEHGGFPYGASAGVLARLRPNEEAAEDFFRQVLGVFERGQEGFSGVKEFAGLLDQGAAMEAISEESAEEAGRAVVAQLRKLTEMRAGEGSTAESATPDAGAGPREETAAAGAGIRDGYAATTAAPAAGAGGLTEEQKREVALALKDVRLSAPKADEQARKDSAGLFAIHPSRVTAVDAPVKVDVELESAFHELAEAMRVHGRPDELRAVIGRGLKIVNSRYKGGGCAECVVANSSSSVATNVSPSGAANVAQNVATNGASSASLNVALSVAPDPQSWALVSLAAYASPMTIGTQLNAIEDPFWRGYFLAIAAQQVGEPTRVADPTARRVAGKEVAEPE